MEQVLAQTIDAGTRKDKMTWRPSLTKSAEAGKEGLANEILGKKDLTSSCKATKISCKSCAPRERHSAGDGEGALTLARLSKLASFWINADSPNTYKSPPRPTVPFGTQLIFQVSFSTFCCAFIP